MPRHPLAIFHPQRSWDAFREDDDLEARAERQLASALRRCASQDLLEKYADDVDVAVGMDDLNWCQRPLYLEEKDMRRLVKKA